MLFSLIQHFFCDKNFKNLQIPHVLQSSFDVEIYVSLKIFKFFSIFLTLFSKSQYLNIDLDFIKIKST